MPSRQAHRHLLRWASLEEAVQLCQAPHAVCTHALYQVADHPAKQAPAYQHACWVFGVRPPVKQSMSSGLALLFMSWLLTTLRAAQQRQLLLLMAGLLSSWQQLSTKGMVMIVADRPAGQLSWGMACMALGWVPCRATPPCSTGCMARLLTRACCPPCRALQPD